MNPIIRMVFAVRRQVIPIIRALQNQRIRTWIWKYKYESKDRNMDKCTLYRWVLLGMIFIMRRGGRGEPVVIIEAGYGWDGQRAKQQPEDHQNIRICSKISLLKWKQNGLISKFWIFEWPNGERKENQCICDGCNVTQHHIDLSWKLKQWIKHIQWVKAEILVFCFSEVLNIKDSKNIP